MTHILDLKLAHNSLRVFQFKIAFSLCSAGWVIFICLSSGSVTLYSVTYNLLLSPFSESFIQALFFSLWNFLLVLVL